MRVSFEFVVENALAEYLLKLDLDKKFVRAIFDVLNAIDWGEIAYQTDIERQQRAFIEVDDINASLMYWPSFERALAITALQIIFTTRDAGDSFKAVYNEFKTDFDMIEGSGQWCLWDEDEWLFVDNLKELTDIWLSTGLFFEDSPQEVKAKLSKVGYAKAERFAKHIAKTKKKPFESIADFLEAIED